MSLEISDLELRSSKDLIDLQGHCVGVADRTRRKTCTEENESRNYRPLVQLNGRKSLHLRYLSIESLLVLLCLTALLLLLPLMLPPLPPPTPTLLLIPICMLVFLILVCMPSDVHDIALPNA